MTIDDIRNKAARDFINKDVGVKITFRLNENIKAEFQALCHKIDIPMSYVCRYVVEGFVKDLKSGKIKIGVRENELS